MSGGTWNYMNNNLGYEIFGWGISFDNPIGSEKYQKCLRSAVRQNPLHDLEMSELFFDIFTLMHVYDYTFAGDYGEDDLQQEVTVFKDKWFKTSRKEQAKAVIDLSLDILREDLYACFCPESTSHE